MARDSGAWHLFEQLQSGQWETLMNWQREQIAESVNLKFKPRGVAVGTHLTVADKVLIARALSGFANVSGGLLCFGFGTTRNPTRKGTPDRLTSVLPFQDYDRFKNFLERNVPNLTDPMIPGIQVMGISSPTESDKGVVILYIPESIGGPHMAINTQDSAIDHRYYVRIAGSTSIMEHSILSAMFGRRARSDLRLRLVPL